MGAQSTDPSLTENWGRPGPTGSHLYVGIDVGRHVHLVAAIPRQRMEDGSWEHAIARRFPTGAEGFRELTEWLASFSWPPTEVLIGCEPTGGWYARTVVAWLEQRGYQIIWLQNWAVHDRRHLLIGKQAKTDAMDARLIARLLFERECRGLVGGFLCHPRQSADALRLLVRNRLKLVGLRTRYGHQLAVVEDVLFPELKEICKDVTGLAVRMLLERYPIPADLAIADPTEVADIVINKARARRLKSRVAELQQRATESAGLTIDVEQIIHTQQWVLRQLRLMDVEIASADAAIAATLAGWPVSERAILESLPGMSPLCQAVLLSTIGELAGFRDDRQLRKLLGWYPEACESGTTVFKHRLGQSGNRMARREIWLWTMRLISPTFPPTPFRAYYQRLRDRGMPGRVAIGHVASKLISVLFYCLRSGQPYDPIRHAHDLALDEA